jgi:hypothetical protein
MATAGNGSDIGCRADTATAIGAGWGKGWHIACRIGYSSGRFLTASRLTTYAGTGVV